MESAFDAVFGVMQHVAWWQECLRAILAFVYGLVILRCTGRRTFAAWSAIDIIVSIVFGSSMSRMITGSAPMPGTFAAMSLLIFLHWLTARGVAVSRKLSLLLEGPPIEITRSGMLDATARLKQSVSQSDLEEALRGSGIESIEQARLIVVEPSGKISVLKNQQA